MVNRFTTWLAGSLVATLVIMATAADDKADTKAAAKGAAAVGLTPEQKAKLKAMSPQEKAKFFADLPPEQREMLIAKKKAMNKQGGMKNGEPLSPEAEKAALAAMPPKPQRKITPPTIDAVGIDAALDKTLASSKIVLANGTSDVEFIRRIYLDTTGKLPTPEQTVRFCGSTDKKKRSRLIDDLVKGDSFAQNWARYWRDVVAYRAPNTNPAQVGYDFLETWLADQFKKNTPWDEITTELITATGSFDENGASAFALAETSAPVEMAGEVSRIFLGVQIQCAQCHDHPNDPWKREQFHELAAFFQGANSRRAGAQVKGVRAVFEVVNQPGIPRYTMPDLKDPTVQIPIKPKFFLASSEQPIPEKLPVKARRELAARYVTAQDNPWFAKAFVNRTWASLIGEGFVNPIDDLGPTREVHHAELFDDLAAQWQAGGYDVRWLYTTILNTKAYQRQIRSTNTAAGRTAFAANCSSRLRSDQILDALIQVLKLPDGQANASRAMPANGKKAAEAGVADAKGKKAAEAIGVAVKAIPKGQPNGRALFNTVFGVDPSVSSDEVLGTIPQALFLMNSPLVNQGITRKDSVVAEILNGTPDNHMALDLLYVRVLARKPTPKELTICGHYLEAVGNRREVFEDILWSLINSTEFLSRR